MAALSLMALEHLFETHRIVFWYDEQGDLYETFRAWSMEGIRKLELDRNAFTIKYKVLIEAPKDKFLIYSKAARPDIDQDWLRDLYLAHGAFKTDEVSLILTELGLSEECFKTFIGKYLAFFKKKDYLATVKASLFPRDETKASLSLKMLAVAMGVSPNDTFNDLLMMLLDEVHLQENSPLWQRLQEVQLEGLFWDVVREHFGYYREGGTSLFEFVFCLFEYMWRQESKYFTSAVISFFNTWRNHQHYLPTYCRLADEIERLLGVDAEITTWHYEDFEQLDCVKAFDYRTVTMLAHDIFNFSISREDVKSVIWQQRKGSYWRKDFQATYVALDAASEFLTSLPRVDFSASSAEETIQKYVQSWHRFDYLYRIFHLNLQQACAKEVSVDFFDKLREMIDRQYVTNAQFKMNLAFQTGLDKLSSWEFGVGFLKQSNFYATKVAPRQHKLCVIISDALRYEIATSLVEDLQKKSFYEAKLEPMIATLPSYTQLGMAALLPHQTLELSMKQPGTVLVDGKPSVGLEDRQAILQAACPHAVAIRSKDLEQMTAQEIEVLKKHDLIYVYHNTIDAIGDKASTEDQTFCATQTALNEIDTIIKKIGRNKNINHFIITADHGFMYQNKIVEEGDFRATPTGGNILFKKSRFVLGTGLSPAEGWRLYTSQQLRLAGAMEVLLPTSVGKCRLQGAGSRFTHGGAALQEVIVPVITLDRRKDAERSRPVELEIIQDSNTLISTSNFTVRIAQREAVEGKVTPRTARVVLKSEAGDVIYSSVHEHCFDFTSKDAEQRIMTITLSLNHEGNKLSQANVMLYLEEPIPRTSEYKVLSTRAYRVLRRFGNDFDF